MIDSKFLFSSSERKRHAVSTQHVEDFYHFFKKMKKENINVSVLAL